MTIALYANQPGINWQTVTQFTPNTGPDMSNQGSYITYYPPTIPTGPNVTEP
ncbi:hypothetical protein HDE76_001293 [Rhodanobacter sp. ANJX3]|nr:hypothetical protein [Rhodanobacter sp. ANJX3]